MRQIFNLQYIEGPLVEIMSLDFYIMIYFSFGLVYNFFTNEKDIVLWIVSPFYIVASMFCLINIYKNFQVKETVVANSLIFTSQVIGGAIALYFAVNYENIPGYVLSILSIITGIYGLNKSKKYLSIENI